MSIEKKCENCKNDETNSCDYCYNSNFFEPREDEKEKYIEYVKQLSNLFGKEELCQQLLDEVVHYKWPIITKQKLIEFLLEREHKIDEIIKEK